MDHTETMGVHPFSVTRPTSIESEVDHHSEAEEGGVEAAREEVGVGDIRMVKVVEPLDHRGKGKGKRENIIWAGTEMILWSASNTVGESLS